MPSTALRPRLQVFRTQNVFATAPTVVIDDLGLAIAVCVKLATDVAEAVPLRRILRVQQHGIIADHINPVRIKRVERIVEAWLPLVIGGKASRRKTTRIKDVAPRVVERQAQAKTVARLDLRHALQHFCRREQVEPPQLIIQTKFAPVGSCRSVFPALFHDFISVSQSVFFRWDHQKCAPRVSRNFRL